MTRGISFDASRLIRQLRRQAGLTQNELAERIGTTQSVISRLESDDYEGHSLSMLYRIGVALNRRIVVTAVGGEPPALSVRERAPSYGPAASSARASNDGLSAHELDRFAERLVQRFSKQGMTKSDVEEAVRWAKGAGHRRSVADLRGSLKVGPGRAVDDVRRARARRGRDTRRP